MIFKFKFFAIIVPLIFAHQTSWACHNGIICDDPQCELKALGGPGGMKRSFQSITPAITPEDPIAQGKTIPLLELHPEVFPEDIWRNILLYSSDKTLTSMRASKQFQ